MGLAGGFVMVVFFSFWGRAFGRAHLGRIQGAAQIADRVRLRRGAAAARLCARPPRARTRVRSTRWRRRRAGAGRGGRAAAGRRRVTRGRKPGAGSRKSESTAHPLLFSIQGGANGNFYLDSVRLAGGRGREADDAWQGSRRDHRHDAHRYRRRRSRWLHGTRHGPVRCQRAGGLLHGLHRRDRAAHALSRETCRNRTGHRTV